jgi:hypothetical protein
MVRALLRLTLLGFVGLVTAGGMAPSEAAPPKAPPKRTVTTTVGGVRRTMVINSTAVRPGSTRVYTVEARSPRWQHRHFTSRPAARTFYSRLARMHFQRKMHHHSGSKFWHVDFRARHWHRYGATINHAAANSMAASLRAQGLQARVR